MGWLSEQWRERGQEDEREGEAEISVNLNFFPIHGNRMESSACRVKTRERSDLLCFVTSFPIPAEASPSGCTSLRPEQPHALSVQVIAQLADSGPMKTASEDATVEGSIVPPLPCKQCAHKSAPSHKTPTILHSHIAQPDSSVSTMSEFGPSCIL